MGIARRQITGWESTLVIFFQSPETTSRSQKGWETKKNSPMKRDKAKDSLVELVGVWARKQPARCELKYMHSEHLFFSWSTFWEMLTGPQKVLNKDAFLTRWTWCRAGTTRMSISAIHAYVPLMGVESMGYVNTRKTTWIWNVLREGEAVNSWPHCCLYDWNYLAWLGDEPRDLRTWEAEAGRL